MQTRQLGSSDLHITPIGIGAWAIGGGNWEYGWGPQDDADSVGAIHAALDQGINWIDTAAAYGFGHSETIVARALKGRGSRPYVFTKCSLLEGEAGKVVSSLKADSVRRELEGSLRRLEVDVIDLYQIHWPFPEEEVEEGWATLAQLHQEGKVRYIGVSNFSVEQMRRCQAIAPITSLQPPYSLVNRDIEAETLPFCQQHNIGVIVYSPMASGLLTGAMTRERAVSLPPEDWRTREADFQEPRLSRHLSLVELLRRIGAAHGRTAGEVAIAWTLRQSAVTGAIVGLRAPRQISGVIGALDFRLSDSEISAIEDFCQKNP